METTTATPVRVRLGLRVFNQIAEAVPTERSAGAALARVDTSHHGGTVLIACDETEALDLLECTKTRFPEVFVAIREALRHANFQRYLGTGWKLD